MTHKPAALGAALLIAAGGLAACDEGETFRDRTKADQERILKEYRESAARQVALLQAEADARAAGASRPRDPRLGGASPIPASGELGPSQGAMAAPMAPDAPLPPVPPGRVRPPPYVTGVYPPPPEPARAAAASRPADDTAPAWDPMPAVAGAAASGIAPE